MSSKFLIAVAVCAGLAAAPAAAQGKPNSARETMRSLGMKTPSGKKLQRKIAEAEKHPLGSRNNPIRENMPQGQRAYLARLRCPEGPAPAVERRGNIGEGVYGSIIDHYSITCPGKPAVDVFMDMYHDGPEDRPVPGFTIVPARPNPG
jgi:hypothetical protein